MAKITFRMKLGGMDRKRITGIMAGVLGSEAVYRAAPNFEYSISAWTLTKDSTLVSPPVNQRLMNDELPKLLRVLMEAGVTTEGKMTVTLSELATRTGLNITAIINGKSGLLRTVFQCEDGELCEREEHTIRLLLFPATMDAAWAQTQLFFATKLLALADNLSRVNIREASTPNPRYTFRCFLIRLGFIGSEYRQARKLLTQNLEGNSAWLAGHAPSADVNPLEYHCTDQEGDKPQPDHQVAQES